MTPSLVAIISHLFFFFNDTATTEIYTLSLHDALPISGHAALDDLTEQPGPPMTRSWRRHPGRRRMGACETHSASHPHRGRKHTGTTSSNPPLNPAGAFLAPDHRPPLAHVQLVRPRQRPTRAPRAPGADTSTLLVWVSPGERFGRLSFK